MELIHEIVAAEIDDVIECERPTTFREFRDIVSITLDKFLDLSAFKEMQ